MGPLRGSRVQAGFGKGAGFKKGKKTSLEPDLPIQIWLESSGRVH